MEEATEQQGIIEQLFSLLEQLLLPNWGDLIALVPWVLMAVIVAFALHTAWQWRRASARNRPRVAPRLAGGAPPPGVHLPGPSRWPFVVPIGAALLLFALALPPRDDTGAATSAFNTPLLIAGLIVSAIAVVGWLIDAMREWRATAEGVHAADVSAQLGGGHAPPALGAGSTSAMVVAPATGVVAAPAADADAERYPEPPPGVHMPGPSPWPFFVPIALTVMLYGLIFSAVLLVAGLVLGIIAAAGWYIEAGREYRSTEAVGHAVPATRDPQRAWPRRLVPVFSGVIALGLLVTLAPVGLGWINSLVPGEATPTPVAVPAVPEISASNAVSFDTDLLVVPAGRPFELTFNNNDDGVPHNVSIAESASLGTLYFDGEVINGVASITYQVEAIEPGDYYFLCIVHPNMNGTARAVPETGGSGGQPGQPGQQGGGTETPDPGEQPPAGAPPGAAPGTALPQAPSVP